MVSEGYDEGVVIIICWKIIQVFADSVCIGKVPVLGFERDRDWNKFLQLVGMVRLSLRLPDVLKMPAFCALGVVVPVVRRASDFMDLRSFMRVQLAEYGMHLVERVIVGCAIS